MAYFDIPTYGSGRTVAAPPSSTGGFNQYAADDISSPAMGQRQWWQQAAQPNPNAAGKATDPNKPTVESLSAVKNQAFAGPQKSLLEDFNLGKEAGNKGFADYLAEANQINAQAKTDLSQDRNALDTGDFAARLAGIRGEQKANLFQQRDELLKSRAGERERAMATSGLPAGMSSDLENRSLSAWLSASLPVNQQILGQQAADAELIQRMNMGTAGQRSALSQGYLNTLLGPERNRQSMLGGYINTLGGLQNLDQGNTFYEKLVQQPYRNNVPILPVNAVNGAGYVPGVRAVAPMNFTRPQGGGGNGGGRLTSVRSQAEIDYQRDTGYWPQEDPNFNTMLYQSYGGPVGQRNAPYARRGAPNNYPPNPPANPFAEEDSYFNSLPDPMIER